MYYMIAFYQRIVELLCHATNFPNDLVLLFMSNLLNELSPLRKLYMFNVLAYVHMLIRKRHHQIRSFWQIYI